MIRIVNQEKGGSLKRVRIKNENPGADPAKKPVVAFDKKNSTHENFMSSGKRKGQNPTDSVEFKSRIG